MNFLQNYLKYIQVARRLSGSVKYFKKNVGNVRIRPHSRRNAAPTHLDAKKSIHIGTLDFGAFMLRSWLLGY